MGFTGVLVVAAACCDTLATGLSGRAEDLADPVPADPGALAGFGGRAGVPARPPRVEAEARDEASGSVPRRVDVARAAVPRAGAEAERAEEPAVGPAGLAPRDAVPRAGVAERAEVERAEGVPCSGAARGVRA
ncbi:hypothetical protein Misp01_73000 [Microtetraspora sp. NBRC 13810]|nr:hypothetical protein Misp01_73000 [Microtetraspora sp. NBRC 13810]